jgi:L-lysine exporter family protein LysE/ArgO
MIYEKLLLGVSFAAPIGPVTAEALRRGLSGGFFPAFRIKFGAAIGDTAYLIGAYFGLAAIMQYQKLVFTLAMVGSLLLMYIGIRNIKKSLVWKELSQVNSKASSEVFLGLGISLTNPFAIAWWLSVFSVLLLETNSGHRSIDGLIENSYIIVGILLWDVFFCTLLEGGKRIMSRIMVQIITGAAGAGLCGLAIYYAYRAFTQVLG